MKLTIPDTQTTPITVIASPGLDAAGNAGVFAGALSWSTSDASMLKLTPSADTLSVGVELVGPGALATVTATDGIVSASFDVGVVASEANDIVFTVAPAAPATAASAAQPDPAAQPAASTQADPAAQAAASTQADPAAQPAP